MLVRAFSLSGGFLAVLLGLLEIVQGASEQRLRRIGVLRESGDGHAERDWRPFVIAAERGGLR